VIVVGVLVALALDGWWQTREDRLRESVYLESVVAELQSYITELEAGLAGNGIAHDALERARQMQHATGQRPREVASADNSFL
jgi:hypothetical protein